MGRSAVTGALVFGVGSFAAGYVWTALEFPFAVVAPWIAGWIVVVWPLYGWRRALLAGVVGGASYTIAWLFFLALAIGDGSPVPLAGWLAPPLGAAVAGALTGALLARGEGARVVAMSSAIGALAGSAGLELLRGLAPPGTDVPGVAQSMWFATAQGLSGAAVGAAIGAAVAAVHHRTQEPQERASV
jgi:hypothetical protein